MFSTEVPTLLQTLAPHALRHRPVFNSLQRAARPQNLKRAEKLTKENAFELRQS